MPLARGQGLARLLRTTVVAVRDAYVLLSEDQPTLLAQGIRQSVSDLKADRSRELADSPCRVSATARGNVTGACHNESPVGVCEGDVEPKETCLMSPDPPTPDRVADHLTVFEEQRPRLMGICYRILGSVTDAQDVLQEGWIRWSQVDLDLVDSNEAFITTIVTRLCVDRLRRLQARREVYTGPWLPEPVVPLASPQPFDPAAAVELADDLSMALLVVLETLSPLERAAFVLREVFQRPYPEVANALGRSEATVRQLVHRARDRVDEGPARYRADRTQHAEVLERFMTACLTAGLDALLDVLAPDVVIVSDGGGVAKAPRRPVFGRNNVARLIAGILHKLPDGAVGTVETFNGAMGIVVRVGTEPVSSMAIHVAGGKIESLQLQANPDKLWPLRARVGVSIV